MSFRSPREIWETALGSLQVQVNATAYDTWLRHTTGLAFDGDEFIIGAPNAFVAEWLQRRMRSLLERTLTEVLKHPAQVAIRVGTEAPAPAPRDARSQRAGSQLPLLLGQTPQSRFTFDSFVVGENSRFAYAAAHAVAENPGRDYNPLFLYGPSGLGKTHLLHAVAHAVHLQQRAMLLTTSEQFVNDFVGSLRAGHADTFRTHYRSAEVLLVDDVQFICGKSRSEECLFHTCNTLLAAGSQVILTADRPPAELPLVNPRLASRLQASLLADLRAPDYPTRLAILTAKAGQLPLPIPEDVLHSLAARPYTSVRQLEGELTKAVALASLLGQPLTPAVAAQAHAGDRGGLHRPLSHAAILQAVTSYFHISHADLASKSRERSLVRARHLAMYLLRTHTGSSFEQIGRLLGGRDHTTVLHGVDKIAKGLPSDLLLQDTAQAILNDACSHP